MNSPFPNRWSFSYLKFTKYVTNRIAEPKYKYGQQEQVTKHSVTYQVRDLNNEKHLGSFYTRELSPAKQNIFRIEKVIKRKNKKALVKWVGYSDKHNSWVPFSDLITI